ncbi:MAG TPA: hypothetical protein VFT16_02830 [Candidatus Saccharimonadales bacterium]|nr:hypothetical protein [Candidatus Saccharimonadales bacterium]
MMLHAHEALLFFDDFEFRPSFDADMYGAIGALALPCFAQRSEGGGDRQARASEVAKAQLDAEDAARRAAHLKEMRAAERLRRENEGRKS